MIISKRILATSALVGVTALGAVGVADAAALRQTETPGANPAATPHVVRVAGKIQSVTASGFVLQAGRNRTVNINAGTDTWVLVEKNSSCAEGQLSDLQTGKAAEVAGMSTSAANTIEARLVAQGRCAAQINRRLSGATKGKGRAGLLALAAHFATGSVQAINGNTLTVATNNGKQVTVNTSADTVVFANGFATVGSLKVGDNVQVFGKAARASTAAPGPPTTNRVINAWALHSESTGTKMLLGRVQKVDGNTVTLRTRASKTGLPVTLDSNAAYKLLTLTDQKWSLTPASSADIKAGTNVVIEANVAQDGKSAIARSIVVLPVGKAAAAQP